MAILGEPVTHNSNFEEGRRTSSRSSSHDSDSSPRTRTALLAPDSGDEAETLAGPNTVETEAEAPLVRPPVVPVWGGGSAFGGFYQRSTSSPFHQQPSRNSPMAETDVGRDDSTESTPAPAYPTAEAASDNNTTNALRADDSRKTSIPSLLISSAASLSPVPSSLHDFSSPQASSSGAGAGSSFPLTPDSAVSAPNAGPSNPSSRAGTDRPSSPPLTQTASNNQTSQTPTHSGPPARGRGAKRGTKPGAKRGEWRVKNYAGNTVSANGEHVQPADPSTYSSFFKIAPPTVPVVEPESNLAQNGNGSHQVASSSNLRLQVPSDASPGHLSRSASPREHPADNDVYNNGADDFNQYQSPPSPQPVPDAMASGVQPTRLVAIVIEDKRYGCTDLQLVEVHVPVMPRSGGSLWVEANDVCEALQKGPSRIDGPAKVYTYRGQYRQYFLRVSIDNRDTYGPANLEITQKRVLKAYVEPDVPPRTVVMEHNDPNSATSLYRPPVQHPSGYLVSPATPGSSDYGRSPVDFNHASRNLLKRNYDYSASSSSGFQVTPSPPIPSSNNSASKKPRRQQSSSNA